MPVIEVTNNWDGSADLSLDGEPVLVRRPVAEVREKRIFLETQLLVRTLEEQEKALTPNPQFDTLATGNGGNSDASQISDKG